MKTDIDRLVAAIASKLTTAGIKVILDGHEVPDASRGTAWVRILPLRAVRGFRNTRADAFISLTCFSSTTSSAFSHYALADSCMAALGLSMMLYKTNGTTVEGVAVLAAKPKLQNLGEINKTLQCVLDLDYIYNT